MVVRVKERQACIHSAVLAWTQLAPVLPCVQSADMTSQLKVRAAPKSATKSLSTLGFKLLLPFPR